MVPLLLSRRDGLKLEMRAEGRSDLPALSAQTTGGEIEANCLCVLPLTTAPVRWESAILEFDAFVEKLAARVHLQEAKVRLMGNAELDQAWRSRLR